MVARVAQVVYPAQMVIGLFRAEIGKANMYEEWTSSFGPSLPAGYIYKAMYVPICLRNATHDTQPGVVMVVETEQRSASI